MLSSVMSVWAVGLNRIRDYKRGLPHVAGAARDLRLLSTGLLELLDFDGSCGFLVLTGREGLG